MVIISATTSQDLIKAKIPLTTLESVFKDKGGVVLDKSATVDHLGVVSAANLKAAYQKKKVLVHKII